MGYNARMKGWKKNKMGVEKTMRRIYLRYDNQTTLNTSSRLGFWS